ncbi:hypothetical protein D3C81_1449070 [compost metagenome]
MTVEFLRGDLFEHVEHFRVWRQAVLQLLGFGNDAQDFAGLRTAHHRRAAVRPGEDEAWIESASAHRIVAGTVGTADDHRQFRHPCIGYRLNQFRAVFDHALLLGFGADHETGGVVKEQQRRLALIAQLNELRRFARAVGCDRAVVADEPAGAALNL